MTLRTRGRWFLLSLNFAFVSWGVLFLIGLLHGIYREELQGSFGLKVIFAGVSLLHLTALLCLASAVYNGIAYVFQRVATSRRERKHMAT